MARKKKAAADDFGSDLTPQDFKDNAKEIIDVDLSQFNKETYLIYALSVIRGRALVDGDDGLEPVHRRIIWTMFEDGVLPNKGNMKVGRIAGNVMRYHPHAVDGDTIARMAQPYSLRVPLVDGSKGNFGPHPGDKPAAGRYIETKLTQAAMELLEDTRNGSTEMVKNFDGKLLEPKILPTRWPVALINGNSTGIAVGYSASMPSHNPTEALKLCRLLLKKPDASINEVMKAMPGPDFWTGGIILGTSGIKEYYETGKGSFTIRSKYTIEYGERGKSKIIFYELPPDVSTRTVVDKVRELIRNGDPSCKYISDINDYTGQKNKHDVRLLVNVKRDGNPEAVAAGLFKKTATKLQLSYHVLNTVVVGGRPVVLGVRELVKNFLMLREHGIILRSNNAINTKMTRMSMIDGIITVLVDIDKVISIVRHSENSTTAADKLRKAFHITAEQADYILAMPLKRLTKQDGIALKSEKKQLQEDIDGLNKILHDKDTLIEVLDGELANEEKIIGDKRYTEVSSMTVDEVNAIMKREGKSIRKADKDIKSNVTILANGKILLSDTQPKSASDSKIGSRARQPYTSTMQSSSKGRVLMMADDGIAYSLPMQYLVEGKPMNAQSLGVLPKKVSLVTLMPDASEVMLFTRNGKVRKYKYEFRDNWTDKQFINLDDDDRIIGAVNTENMPADATVILVTAQGKTLRFDPHDIKPTGLGSNGIAGMKLKGDDTVVKVTVARKKSDNLITISKHSVKTTPVSDITVQSRGGTGTQCHTIIGNDEITDAIVDGAVIQNGKIIAPPPATKRTGKFAPAMGISLVS
jgi:DNA gyrase subunit A